MRSLCGIGRKEELVVTIAHTNVEGTHSRLTEFGLQWLEKKILTVVVCTERKKRNEPFTFGQEMALNGMLISQPHEDTE